MIWARVRVFFYLFSWEHRGSAMGHSEVRLHKEIETGRGRRWMFNFGNWLDSSCCVCWLIGTLPKTP